MAEESENVDYFLNDDYIVDDDGPDMEEIDNAMLNFRDSDESSLSDEPTEEGTELGDGDGQKISKPDQVRMIHLRRYLDQLAESVLEREYEVQKTREELKKCRLKIEELCKERDIVYRMTEENESTGNRSAVNRLRAQHHRVLEELENETDLEKQIQKQLEQTEYELNKAQVEQGKYILAEDELRQKEDRLQKERTEAALERGEKEYFFAEQTRAAHKASKRAQRIQARTRREREIRLLQEADESQKRANYFLKETMDKMKRREEQEAARDKEQFNRRIQSMLKLKQDISANRENLRALQARDRVMAQKAKEREESEAAKILAAGGNAMQEVMIKKRNAELLAQKTAMEQKMKTTQRDIMAKLVLEQDGVERKKQLYPHLYETPAWEQQKRVKPHEKRKLRTLEILSDQLNLDSDEKQASDEKAAGDKGRTILHVSAADEESEEEVEEIAAYNVHTKNDLPSSDSECEANINMAQPEFYGLWNKEKHRPYTVPKDKDNGHKVPGASKMEQEIFEERMDKHRVNIVQKQVAAGREFTGVAFYSKPDIIHFKDFDVGKTYHKKVILTNVSYSINFCKLTGMTEKLKDFIKLEFHPPGQMSAGMTCNLSVTFKPMINEDLEGSVQFLCQTGPFHIPIRCSTKKCNLSVDNDNLQFGTSVIGETLRRTFTLINTGALATDFEFVKITGMKQRSVTTAETSLGRLTTAESQSHVGEEDPAPPAVPDKGKKGAKKQESKEEKPVESVEETEVADADGSGSEEKGPDLAAVPEEGDVNRSVGSSLSVVDEDEAAIDGMKTGVLVSGELGPNSRVTLEVIWQPTVPGRVDTEFCVRFSDPLSDAISLRAQALAIDVPVWVERENVDLKICMYDRLYQDTIIVNNRATTALQLRFEVCKELRNQIELLPKTGYIQAQSKFSAQLKFLPRANLAKEAGEFFDPETGVLQAPMIIKVAGQTRPVPFTVHAVVTTSDLEFDTTDIDFGCCTINESVYTTVRLSNKSILPQDFGFLGHPDYVQVQPNDGFGTLLPEETILLDVIVSPTKADEFAFDLCCKSLINREFKIKCQGIGVHPPLKLSKQVVHFQATSLNDISSTAIHVINDHIDMNEFSHPVPRIGKGPIEPVGETSFEFAVPEGLPIKISPTVGTVKPGERCRVQMFFQPQLSDHEVRVEAVRMVSRDLEAAALKEYEEMLRLEAEEAAAKNKKGAAGGAPRKGSPKGRKDKAAPTAEEEVRGPKPIKPPETDEIDRLSDVYSSALGSLMRQFRGDFSTWAIPCYIASGAGADPGSLPYSIHNTLYVEAHCPVVRPELVIISDSGRSTTDFGEVSIGQNSIRSITIQNITDHPIEVQHTALDPAGPFVVLNAMRTILPDATHTILVKFTPNNGEIYQEKMVLKSKNSALHLVITGQGVTPRISTTVEGGLFDMSAVLVEEWVERTFKIENTCTLAIDYAVHLDSNSSVRHGRMQHPPKFVDPQSKNLLVGVQNNNGQNVFDIVPAEGTIAPGESQEVTVSFAPDHESDLYSDYARITLFGEEEVYGFQLKGQAKPHIMFIEAEEPLAPPQESLAALSSPSLEGVDLSTQSLQKTVILTLHSVAQGNNIFTPGTRDLLVGCVRTMAVSQKKNGEFWFDNTSVIQAAGFNLDPQKGMIEAGVKKPVTFTWSPPTGHDPNKMAESEIMLSVRGDTTDQVRVLLRAMVVSA